jgi:hypothetical protein
MCGLNTTKLQEHVYAAETPTAASCCYARSNTQTADLAYSTAAHACLFEMVSNLQAQTT